MLYLGIDLGTTYSLIAYVNEQGNPSLFPDFHDANQFRTPSVVYLSKEGCLVGAALEELLDDDPSIPHARFFKLEMGKRGAIYQDHLGREWWPQGLSAMVLRKLLDDVDAFSSEEIGGVLIAVPANFNDQQRKATREAAAVVGIGKVKLIEEPVAAATFYGFGQRMTEQTLFVYDLGGGTFDATVLQVGDDGLYALATEGNNSLGGKRVEEIIMKYISEEYARHYGFRPLDPTSEQIMRRFAHDTKLRLSKPGKGKVSKTLVLLGETIDIVLTRKQLNQMISAFVDETIKVSQRCLEAAGLDWDFVDVILLTGGSSLLPLVTEKLSQASGKPADQLICKQPHQAVAYGAALLAAQQFKGGGRNKKTLQSICAYDLGIRTLGANGRPTVKVLVPRNSPVPAAATTTFYTNRDDQSRMIIEAVQQRPNKDAVEEYSLGYFAFAIEHPRRRYPVEITLAYDLEGSVMITARDPETDQQMEQVMDKETKALDRALLAQRSWLAKLRVNR